MKLWIWSHLLKKSLMENLIFRAMLEPKLLCCYMIPGLEIFIIYSTINYFQQFELLFAIANIIVLDKISAAIYLFKVNDINTTTMCQIRSKLTIKMIGRRPLLTFNK